MRKYTVGWAYLLMCASACAPYAAGHDETDMRPVDAVSISDALTPGCTTHSALLGIDVSEFQGKVDWQTVAATDVRFAFIRVADGTFFRDLFFQENWRAAKAAGIPRGAYHFFDPSEDAIEQAQFFVESVGALEPGDLPPVLDFETLRGVSPTEAVREADRWIGYVRRALGVDPIVYTGPSFWEDVLGAPTTFAPYEPWISHYTGGCPWVPSPWNQTRFHQFTERGWIPGIDGYVDLNWFYGDIGALRALQVKAPSPPGGDNGMCVSMAAQSGQVCADGCIYSTWAVSQGYQPGHFDCGGTACACVVEGQVRESCEVTQVPTGGDRGSECAASCVWSTWSVSAGVQPQSHLCAGEPCACVQVGSAWVSCAPSGCGAAPSERAIAEGLLEAHRRGDVTFWGQTFWRADGTRRTDGADALRNIEMTAQGRAALRSCYDDAPCGQVELRDAMLQALSSLQEEYGFRFFVTSIAGASHGDDSPHYEGRAFDVDEIDGVRVNGPTERTQAFMDACAALGAWEVRGPSAASSENRHHIHCAF